MIQEAKKTDCQVQEAKPNEYFQPSACVDRSVNVQSPSEDIQILEDKKVNKHTDSLAEPAKTEDRIDSQNDLMDFNDFPLLVEGMSEGDDPIMAILKDMKPRAKIDCLDNSFSFGESETFPVEIQNEIPIDDSLQNPHGLTSLHEDLGLLSDSSDDAFDRPRKLLTQESQGFLIDSCEQSKSSLLSQEVFVENSPDDEVDIKPVESLMGRNFLSSQGFSFDMDEVSANSEGKDDKENIGTEKCLEIEKVGSKSEKHSQTDTWDLNLSEDDGQCMSRYSEQNGQIDLNNTNTDTVSKVENGEEFVAKKHSTFVGDCKESHKEGEELVEEDRNSKLEEDGMHTHNSIATIDCGLRKSSEQETLIKRPCSKDASSNSIEANSLDVELQEDILIQEPMEPSEKIMEHSLSNDQKSQQSLQEKSSVSAGCCVSERENTSNGSLSNHPQQIFDQNLSQESTKVFLHDEGLFSNSTHPEDIKGMKESRSTKPRTSSESNSSDHSWLLSSESEDDKDLMHKKHVHPKILERKISTTIIAVEVNEDTKTNSKTEGRRNCEETQNQSDNGGDKKEERSQNLTAGAAHDMELQEKINNDDPGSSSKHDTSFMADGKVQLVNKDQPVQYSNSGIDNSSGLTCGDKKDIKGMKESRSTKLRTSSESNSSDHSWLLSSESEDDKDLMHKKHVHPKILDKKISTTIVAVEVNEATKTNSKTEGRRNCEETQNQSDNGGDKKEERSQNLTAGAAHDMELQEKINNDDPGSSSKHDNSVMADGKVQLATNKDQLVQNGDSGSDNCSDLTCVDVVGNRQLFSNSMSAGQSSSAVSTLLEDCSSEKVSNVTEGINNITDLKSLKTDLIQENNPKKDDGVKGELNSGDAADERRMLRNSSSSNCSDSFGACNSEGQFVECTSKTANQNDCIQKSSEDESELSSEPSEEKSSAHCPITNKKETDLEIVCSKSSKVCLSKNVSMVRQSAATGKPVNNPRSTVTRKRRLRNTKNDSAITDSFNLEETECNTSGTKMAHQNVQLTQGNFPHSSTNDTDNTEETQEKDKLCTKLERENEATPQIISQSIESDKINISSKLDNFTVNKDIKISDNPENDNEYTKTVAISDVSICRADIDTNTNVVSPINSLAEDVAGTSDASTAVNTKNLPQLLDNDTVNIEKQLEVEETIKQKLKAADKEVNEESTADVSWPINYKMTEMDKGIGSTMADFKVGVETKDEIVIAEKRDLIKEERNLDTPKERVDTGNTNQKSLSRNPQMAGVRFSWGKSMLRCQKMPSHRNNVEFILQKKITREIPNVCDQLKANVFSLEIRNSRKRKVRLSMHEMQSTCLGTDDKSDIDTRNKVQHNRENTVVNGGKQGKNLLEERSKLPHKTTTKQGSKEALSSLGNSTVMSTQKKSQRIGEPKKSVLKRIKASQSLFSSESSGAEDVSAPCVRKRRIMRKKRNQTNKSHSDSEDAEITNEVSQESSRKVSRFGRKSERDQGRKSTKSDSTASSVGSRTSPCVVKRLKRDSSSSSYGNIRTSVSESDVTSPEQLSINCKDNGKGSLSHQSSAANKEELQIVKNDTSSDSEALEDDEGHFKREHRIFTVVSSDSDNTDIECKEGEQRKKKRAVEVEKSHKKEPHVNTLGQAKKSSIDKNIRKVAQPIQNSKKAKLELSEHLKNISSQSQDIGVPETNSPDTGTKQKFLSVKNEKLPTTFEQAALIASTLKRHHTEIQGKKRTAILLDTPSHFGVKRSKKDHMLPKVSSEEKMQNKTRSQEMVKREQTVAYKSKVFCTSSSDDNSDANKKSYSLVEKTKSKENQSLTQPSVSDSTMKATITPHPGLVSSLAKLGTLDRPKILPKAKTVPKTNVPASSDFIEKLFFTQRSQTNDSVLQCQPKDSGVDATPGREESYVKCMPASEDPSAVQGPITQDPCTSTQQQKAKKLMICDRQTKEELMTFGKASINNVSDSKEPVTLTKENSALSSQLTDGVIHKEAHSQVCQENEKKEEYPKYDMTKNTSEPQHESYIRLLPSTKKSPLGEEKENELRSIVKELATCNINSKEWRRLINKLRMLAASASTPQIIRVFLWGILQQNPMQEKKVLQGLIPNLYQLFQALCVLEIRLGLSLRPALINSIRVLICQPSSHLRPHSLGCLAAWYVANLSASNKEDKEILQLGRAFLVDLLFHHPGTVHLALFSALTSGQRFLIRMVNHREASGIEKVLQWIAFHGIWMGTESVRDQLIKYLTNQIGVHNPPANDLTVLVKDLLSRLMESTELAVSCNLLTSIMILARWQGKPWIQSHLLPAVTALISQESEGGNEGQVEEVPRQLFDMLMDSLGKLNGIFSKDATSADNNKLGCELQELKSALTRLLHLAWGDMKMKPR
ncbi:uncharacterized protein LOC119575251 [Penaeus monodon]|uniref:uncharacterized protein LOC119575251 n=1 Tax=Penaeus monodon TaxID=6687 RepID=UPI0018A7ACD8|nr:uncharacterized protein LOC119575251 [Penaeus monodon]